jgi:hypothetical protein
MALKKGLQTGCASRLNSRAQRFFSHFTKSSTGLGDLDLGTKGKIAHSAFADRVIASVLEVGFGKESIFQLIVCITGSSNCCIVLSALFCTSSSMAKRYFKIIALLLDAT